MSDIGETLRTARTNLLWFAAALAVGAWIAAAVVFAEATGIIAAVAVLGVIVILALWLMAAPRVVSDRGCRWALMAFLTLYVVWPSYISIRIPGLPWIHFARVALAIMSLLFLYCIFNSREIRRDIASAIDANRLLCLCLAGYVASQFMSVAFSPSPGNTAARFFVAQVFWTLPFFVTLAVIRTEKQMMTLLLLVVGIASFEALLGLIETYQKQIVWLRWLPPGFTADLEYLDRILRDLSRDGRYRARGSFLLPLTFAELLAIILPLAYYLLIYQPGRAARIFGAVAVILILPGIFVSNTRLGVNAALVSTAGAVGLAALRLWVRRKESLVGPFVLTMMPLVFCSLVLLLLFNAAVGNATFGGGSTQASTEARFEQWSAGIPKILSSPLFGRGIGGASEILGFFNAGGIPTIDTYMLSVVLEVGIVGAAFFVGSFLVAIVTGSRLFLSADRPIYLLSGALAASCAGFLVIKLVLSQVENHMIMFVMVAMLVRLNALSVRNTATDGGEMVPQPDQPTVTAASPPHRDLRFRLPPPRRRL